MMDQYYSWKVRGFAKKDAEVGQDQAENRITSLIGPRPGLDTEEYSDHGFLADDLQIESTLHEYETAAVVTPRNQDSPSLPAPLLVLGVGLFLGVAAVAQIQLMAILGLSPSNRIFLGISLECLLVAITAGMRNVFNGVTKDWAAFGIIVLYVLFLGSTAAIRIFGLAVPETGPTFMDFAAAVLLVFATAGPAWLAEGAIRSLLESSPRRNREKKTSHQFRTEQRKVRRARNHATNLGVQRRKHDQRHARLLAIYKSIYNQEFAGKNRQNGAAPEHPESQFRSMTIHVKED